MSEEIIKVENLKKTFNDNLEILKGISFSVQKGEVLSIIGPSGSGKSTLLRCISQLEDVTDGTITICGKKLVENGVYVDVRANNLFSQGHIAGSVNITLQDIKSGKLNRIDSYKDKPVILVGKDKMDSDCFNGAVSLKKQGYTKVFTLEGGITQWSMDNLPLSNKN